MKKSNKFQILGLIALLLIGFATEVLAVRVKDLAGIRGFRDNQLIGFSIVVGLNGSGDTAQSLLARKPLKNALERMGISISLNEIKGRSIAAVMVTATLPPFAKQGQRLDVTVSTLGDAISLRGGTLVLSPLRAPNRKVFAVAQGPITGIPLGIETPAGREILGSTKLKINAKSNLVPTVGKVPGGALVEREIKLNLNARTRIFLNLKQPDFTTAFRLAKVVNRNLGDGSAKAIDAGTIEIAVPASYLGQTVELISKIENLEIQPGTVAKVVLDERTGTIVMGTNVRILPVAISHGNLNITISDLQAAKTARGSTAKKATTANVLIFKGGVDIKDVVDGLNKIGISNSELAEVLKTIKTAGALQAELVIK
ncbi:MAG: flagellar P-ring protein precursor FlgI [bacterium]|jgi:flagellar P-ring protein precursor FlgI